MLVSFILTTKWLFDRDVCKYYIGPIGRNTTSAWPIGGVSLMSAAAARCRPMGLGVR